MKRSFVLMLTAIATLASSELLAQRKVLRVLDSAAPAVAKPASSSASPASIPTGDIRTGGTTPLFFLRDKSKVAGFPKLESLRVKTRYGILEVPRSEIVRLRLVRRVSNEIGAKVAEVIEKLGNDDFDIRETAMDEAREIGPAALPLLRKALKSDNEEVKNRAEILVEELEEQATEAVGGKSEDGVESLKGTEDEITTTRMIIRGMIDLESITIASRYGDLKVSISDISGASFQQAGPSMKKLDVEPKYQPPGNWLDTRLKLAKGQSFKVEASGTITVSNYSVSSGPGGTRQWSGNSFNNLPMLSLVGKVGKKGKPFLVGPNYKGKAGKEGKLFLSIVPFSYNPAGAIGKYTTKIRLLAVE